LVTTLVTLFHWVATSNKLFTHTASKGSFWRLSALPCGKTKFFAVFSATVWNFNFKLYTFIFWNGLHLAAK